MAWAPGRHGLDPVYRRNRLIRESIGKRMIVSVFRIFLLVAFLYPALPWEAGDRQEYKEPEAVIGEGTRATDKVCPHAREGLSPGWAVWRLAGQPRDLVMGQ